MNIIARIDHFWHRVNITDECWLWTGGKNNKGYGHLQVNKHFVYAHRFSYELAYGPIPPGLFVCHHCDNTTCVRPAHLFPGTQRDNLRDAASKGRCVYQTHPELLARGERNGWSKLTETNVLEIRSLVAQGKKHRDVAHMFGIYHTTVGKIARGEVWAHLP